MELIARGVKWALDAAEELGDALRVVFEVRR
jgi:hypothetical protein